MVQISMIIVNMALSMRNDYGSDKDRGPTSCSEKWLTAGSLQEMWENCRLYIKPIAWILCISALHFNENRQRHQATKKDTEVRWQISYAKVFTCVAKGESRSRSAVTPSVCPSVCPSVRPKILSSQLLIH
ncbi:uncharacterized protein LOC144619951 isoform X2 [Crassostrea virginica]